MLPNFYAKIQNNLKQHLLPEQQLRKMGLIYSIYRFIISIFLFLSSYALIFQSDKMLVSMPTFFHQTLLLFYGVFSFLLLALFYVIPRYMRRQLGIGLIFDVIVISLLLYLSGTPDIQLIMLYVVVMAASFMMLAPYQAFIITLLAIIFVIYQQFFHAINNDMSIADLGNAILLSLSFLCVGFLSWFVSQRLAMVEKIATEQANEMAKLNIINQQVISTITHGVMVLSDTLSLKLTNLATINLLDLKLPAQVLDNLNHSNHAAQAFMVQLHQQHPKLFTLIAQASQRTLNSFNYDLAHTDAMISKLRINTTPLKGGSLLVMIEDIRREQSSAQQLKLAALGQLTASIAHEIRNPLAAISQASELLIEDAELHRALQAQASAQKPARTDAANVSAVAGLTEVSGSGISGIGGIDSDSNSDSKGMINSAHSVASWAASYNDDKIELYEMIFKQTKRVNRIIEDVLKLSRQSEPNLTTFDLVAWLTQFIDEHYGSHDLFLHAHCTPKIHFDTRQLEQIMVNLVNNGLHYSSKSHPHAYVEIEIDCLKNDVIIDVLDTGAGVAKQHQPNLFNPFFTTNPEGTGLGLYLSQAFTEANHSRLVFVPEHDKTCFRLVIPKLL